MMAQPHFARARFVRTLVLTVFAHLASLAPFAQGSDLIVDTIRKYCLSCHSSESKRGGLDIETILSDEPARHPRAWESVVRRLSRRQMPPAGRSRPDESTYDALLTSLVERLDRGAAARATPGRTDSMRRLNRTEYQNAVRDLLGLEFNAATWLPPDELSHGFDTVGVRELSPTLLDRYITAAQRISRLAVGGVGRSPGGDTIRVRADITQDDRVEGLPIGTRGGVLVRYTFPQDGDYDIQVRLTRDRNEHVEGLQESHELEILLDREPKGTFTVTPPPGRQDFQHVDDHLKLRVPAMAGPHDLGVTFLKNPTSLIETLRQPYRSQFNMHRHPRVAPAVYQVTITGPYHSNGPGDSPSRRRIFVARPNAPTQEDACADQIVRALLRRAYRRPVDDADVVRVLSFYREARRTADFDAAIEAAISAILVSREFLFRVEQDPPGIAPQTAYRISDIALASRLSFFLWASIPDDELLGLAERGELHEPPVLEQQTRRMLADARSQTLVTNFAAQWLYLRNLDSITPDGRLFPDFDDNLRQAMRRETELLFDEIVHRDCSLLGLIRSDHTWLDERLAAHYGIPHVFGPRFRRVPLDSDSHRGGLLRHASILTVTSYATRTSPVLRGKWILENLVGTPPPPPLPDVPALDDNTVSATLPVRERLKLHRANPNCASCHSVIDPVGFSLENFDAVGRWRRFEADRPVDAAGGLPDGSRFEGVAGLESALLANPDVFVGTLTEKLLTYGLGRGVDYHDAAAVRAIVRATRAANYRFSALLTALVQSDPFQMRRSP